MKVSPNQNSIQDFRSRNVIPQVNNSSKNVSFGNAGFNPIVTVMDGIGRGGYIAEFLAQDFCGFIAPRIGTGLNRNREETNEYNWKFAATEAIREFLSGPSMVAIPAIMLWATKKYSGKAKNVPIQYLHAIGNNFEEFVIKPDNLDLTNKTKLKYSYYEHVMKNVLRNASENKMDEAELNAKAQYFTEEIKKMENAKGKGGFSKLLGKKVSGTAEDILGDLNQEFVSVRKKYSGSMTDVLNLTFSSKDKHGKPLSVTTKFDKFLAHLKNYSEDAVEKLSKADHAKVKPTEFVKEFNTRCIASRFKLNVAMNLAVAAFLCFVPKLYKHKDGNPGLAGLNVDTLNKPTCDLQKEGK